MEISGTRVGKHSHWVLDPVGLRVELDPVSAGELPPRIVVGVDGSEESVVALRRAVVLGQQMGAVLDIIMAWQFPVIYGPDNRLGWDPERVAHELLESVLVEVFGSRVPARLVEGSAAAVLAEASEGADMLVVGKRSHAAVTDLVLGSVSERCANIAHCAVLIVPFSSAAVPAVAEQVAAV